MTSTPARRGALGGDGDDERDGEAERVRAGDHEHGDRAHDGVVGDAASVQTTAVMAAEPSANQNSHAGGPVGDALGARARGLRLGDEALDAGEGRVVADGAHADADGRVRRDGSGHDVVAGAAGARDAILP